MDGSVLRYEPNALGITSPGELVAPEEMQGGDFRFYVNPTQGRLSAIIRNDASHQARILVLGQNIAVVGAKDATHGDMLRELKAQDHPALDYAYLDRDADTRWTIRKHPSGRLSAKKGRWPAALFRALGVKPASKAMQKMAARIGRLRLPAELLTRYSDDEPRVPSGPRGGQRPFDARSDVERAWFADLALWEKYNPNHEPGGSSEGGQFTSGDGGGGGGSLAGEAEQDGGASSSVMNVGGDQWNKDTAVRLEKEYQSAKSDLERLADEAVTLGVAVGEGPTAAAQTWDDVSQSVKEDAENTYIDSNIDSEMQYQQESWAENVAPDEARTQVTEEFNTETTTPDWAQEVFDDVRDKHDIPYTDEQLHAAISLKEDGETAFHDILLQEPSNYVEGQGDLLPSGDKSDALTPEMRQEISDGLKSAYDKAVEDAISNMEPPDYLKEQANESLGESWDNMADDDKLSWTKSNTGLLDDESQASDPNETITAPPGHYDPLASDTGNKDYRATQAIARHMSVQRAMQVLQARGITAGFSDIKNADDTLWSGWKASSSGIEGKILQLATSDELGGRMNEKTVTAIGRAETIANANATYANIGGYDGVKAYVRAKWETSQYLLDKSGADVVSLYRAVGIPRAAVADMPKASVDAKGTIYNRLTNIDLKRNGAQSMTTDRNVANGWSSTGAGSNERVVIRAALPRTAVLSVPAFGQNIYGEHEVVIAGTAWKSWDAWLESAPKFEAVPISKAAMVKPYEIDILLTELEDNLSHWLSPQGRGKKAAKSNPNHAPAGSDEGGQFTSGDGVGGGSGLRPAHEDREKWPSHIKPLRVPPAWKNVHVSDDPEAALQVTGEDAKGRTQYIYSAKFAQGQAAEKFARIKQLEAQFGTIERQNSANQKSGDPIQRQHADAMALVMGMGIRPGSESDTGGDVKAYGATTLLGKHVVYDGGTVSLKFQGKHGVNLDLPVEDKRLSVMLKTRKDSAGPDGQLFPDVSSGTLLDYSHHLGDGRFKTKDFRTLLASRVAMKEMGAQAAPKNMAQFKRAVRNVADAVSRRLGNTRTVALQSYIPPAIFAPWQADIERMA